MEMADMIKLFRALIIALALLSLVGHKQSQAYPYPQEPQPRGYVVTHRYIPGEADAEGSQYVWVNDLIVEPTGASAHIRGLVDSPGAYTKLVEFGWVKNLTQPDLPERPVPFYNVYGPGLQVPLRAWCTWCDLVPGREDYHFAVTVEWDDFRGEFVWAWWFEYDVWAYLDVNDTTQDGTLEYVWAGIETRDPVDPDIHVAGPLVTETNSYRTPSGAWHLWYRDRNQESASDADHYCLYSWQGSDANLLLFGGRGIDCWPE